MRRDLIGETLLNQFRIENFIASGGMATVYRVWDLQRSVPLAMKVLHPELADDPAFMARFEREARSLQTLVHPHIVPFYGLFQAEDLTFLLERYIDGPNLEEVLRWRAGKPMSLVEALVYFKSMYTSLGYAHAQGIIHCDVKPGNVLIDQGGHVYLTDFGIARYTDAAVTTSSGLGTPLYMAPEQIRGERLTPRTDIYALGIVLFELLSGARPFRGDVDVPPGVGENQSDRIRYQQLYVDPPDPRAFNPQIPEGLAQVVLKALAKDPAERYPSVQAMATDIEEVIAARFGTLHDRVRIPEGMIQPDGTLSGWPQEAPENVPADAPPADNVPAHGREQVWEQSAGGATVNPDAPGAPGDTLPGLPPAPRPLPENLGASTRPRARLSRRWGALLAGIALLALCAVASASLARAFRLGAAGLPARTNSPATGAQSSATSPQPTLTTNGPKPTATGLSSFPVSGEIAIVQHVGTTDKLVLLDAAAGSQTTLPLVPNVTPSVSNAPQWSPDGQRMTWVSQYNNRLHVVVMDMTEREPYQLPAGEAYARVSAPAFLPDGKHVSFWASGGSASYLVTADATTGQETAKTPLSVFRTMFVWNWRASLLAYIQQSGSTYKVFVGDQPDAGGRLIDTGGEGYAPAWSNDGQWLGFQSDLNRSAGLDEIWIAHPDGGDLHAVTSTPPDFWSRAPSFSPDGKMVAFISNRSGSRGNDYGELFVVDLSTGKIRQMTSTGGQIYDWRPAWRP